MDFAAAVDQVISRHLSELAKPGVLSVRPGYQAAGQWLTKKPAIVVTVAEKRDDLPPDQRLPETIEGYPVDVRQADQLQRLRTQNQSLAASRSCKRCPRDGTSGDAVRARPDRQSHVVADRARRGAQTFKALCSV